MTNRTISLRRDEFNQVFKRMADFYEEPTRNFIYHLYSKGYTYSQVAEIYGISISVLRRKYPKEQS